VALGGPAGGLTMRVRRLRKQPAHLEITAFINLIVVLVPFLLSTAVFTRLAVLDLSLPAQNAGPERLMVDKLLLEVVVRPDMLEVGDRNGGLIRRIPNAGAASDVKALQALMVELKSRYPDNLDASVLAEPTTPYDTLVQVMDAVRGTMTAQGPRIVRTELFPNISIGDAPVVKR
jgi:biopolymer transport protein ExbD